MQNTAPSPILRRPNGRVAQPTFSVVSIHDGFYAGIRAQEALEWLKYTLSSEMQVHSISWSFENLRRLDLRAMSIRAAAAADMIIVSASDTEPLPDHIKQWLSSSLAEERTARPVLVALYDEKLESNCPMGPGPLCTHLQRVADAWQTEFMCNDDFDQRLNHDFATQFIRRKSPDTFYRPEPFGREFYAAPIRWGING